MLTTVCFLGINEDEGRTYKIPHPYAFVSTKAAYGIAAFLAERSGFEGVVVTPPLLPLPAWEPPCDCPF